MKKNVLALTIATFGLGLSSFAQTTAVVKETRIETQVEEEKPLTFSSEEKKNAEVKRIQNLIDLRISQGKTSEELARYYKALNRAKNAVIETK
jgi:hypothetical protein